MLEIDATDQAQRKAAVMAALAAHPFVPPAWLRNPHAQTFWGPLFRRRRVPLEAERLPTPDEDFVYLHHTRGKAGAPRVLLLHGLEGSRESFYVHGFKQLFRQLGWHATLMEFRTCSHEVNCAPRAYHMGETTDLDHVVRTLAARAPEQRIYLVGVSLGANVIGKWLGDLGDAVPPQLRAAAMISTPFNPAAAVDAFHQALGGFYVRRFLRTLIPKARLIEQQFPGILDMEAVAASKEFWSYDTLVTAKLHGFADADDYWQQVGCHRVLDNIRRPTLLISAEDDPFVPGTVLPREKAAASPWLHPLFTAEGGHVGFVARKGSRGVAYWAEEQTLRFLQAYEDWFSASDFSSAGSS